MPKPEPPPRQRGRKPKRHVRLADQAAVVPAVTAAALEAGHEPRVSRVGRRFQLVCSCGWETPADWPRKRAFDAVAQHVWEVGHQAVRDTPGVGDIPQAGSGRA